MNTVPNETPFYLTSAMLEARGACSSHVSRFESTFGVRSRYEKVFLTYKNFVRGMSAGLSLAWLASRLLDIRSGNPPSRRTLVLYRRIFPAVYKAQFTRPHPNRSRRDAQRRAYEAFVQFMLSRWRGYVAPDETLFYITPAMLAKVSACADMQRLFADAFAARTPNTKVFLTFKNFDKAVSAGLPLGWLANKLVWFDALRGAFSRHADETERELRKRFFRAYVDTGYGVRSPLAKQRRARREAYDALVAIVAQRYAKGG